MLPLRCQSSISGPKERCSRNQRFSRVEERANAKAATSKNGVVGNSGSTTPTAARATDVRPARSQSSLLPLSTLEPVDSLQVIVAYEMGTENHEAEDDGDVNQCLLHSCIMSDDACSMCYSIAIAVDKANCL